MARRTATTTTRTAKSTTTRKTVGAKSTGSQSTPKTRSSFAVKPIKTVAKAVSFPAHSTRTSTKASPYTPLIASLKGCGGDKEFLVFENIADNETGVQEFASFQNSLRNIGRVNHNQRIQVVWIKTDNPGQPSGIYVRAAGELQARNREKK